MILVFASIAFLSGPSTVGPSELNGPGAVGGVPELVHGETGIRVTGRVRSAAPRAARLADEVAQRLSELSDPVGRVRSDAEAWLARNVGTAHVGAIASAAQGGDAEVRVRLARIVGDASPDLVMAQLFFGHGDALLRDIGERAFRGRIARWAFRKDDSDRKDPGVSRRPLVSGKQEFDARFSTALRESAARSWPQPIRLAVTGGLEEACSLLMRRGHLPLGIAVDPLAVDPTTELPGPAAPVEDARGFELSGTWDRVLEQLAQRFRVSLEAHGMSDDNPPLAGPGAFLCFRRDAEAGRDSLDDLLLAWCRDIVGTGPPERRAAAARALAGSGWPAALDWLGERWARTGDEAALAGLLRAAGSGRIAARLLDPALLGALIQRVERDFASTSAVERAWAQRALDGLQRLPCLSSVIGAVLAEWNGAEEHGRWMRLVMLEGMACGAGSEAAREVLEDPAASPKLLRQALRAWVASTAGILPRKELGGLETPRELLSLARDTQEAHELLGLLRTAGIQPPGAWRDPARAPAWRGSGPAALLLLSWFAAVGDEQALAKHWRAFARDLRSSSELARFVDPLAVRDREVWARAWTRMQAAGEGGRWVDRSALLARVLPEPALATYAELSVEAEGASLDLELLAVAASWGAGPAGEAARARLAKLWLDALKEDRDPAQAGDLIAALASVLQELERTDLALGDIEGAESEGARFERLIEGPLRSYRRTRIATSLPSLRMPRKAQRPLGLAELDR